MTLSQWIAILTTLVGGGAMGALLNRWFTHRGNRRQPVHFTKEIIHIFRDKIEHGKPRQAPFTSTTVNLMDIYTERLDVLPVAAWNWVAVLSPGETGPLRLGGVDSI